MIKVIAKYSLLLFCACCFCAVAAQTTAGAATQKILKVYEGIKNEKLVIYNKYGDVEVRTWDKNKIEMHITTSAQSTGPGSDKMLSKLVLIKDKRTENDITCRTAIVSPAGTGTVSGTKNLQALQNCTVSYIVYLPKNIDLQINNQFGNIVMPDFDGHLAIDEQYGNFIAGKILSLDTFSIKIGDAYIRNLYYGSLRANGFDSIRIDTVSGNVECGLAGGRILYVGLNKGLHNFTIKSDNINKVIINCARNLDASFSISAILSKFINLVPFIIKDNDNNPVKIPRSDTKQISSAKPLRPDGDSSLILSKKKLEMLEYLSKKTTHFSGRAGNGSGTVSITVAFSYLRIQ